MRRRGPSVPRLGLRLLRRAVFIGLVLGIAWFAVAFLSFRSAVKERNDALPEAVRATLAPANGPTLAADHVTLLVGADTSAFRKSPNGGGEQNARADTLILMRVNVPSRSVSMLSIPRDLYVSIPGRGEGKINSAYADGGLPLAIRTVRQLTGQDVHHVMQIDFDGFKEVVDAIGGVTIDNPQLVESGNTPFDGRRWRFAKGEITLNGRDALAYARIRYVSERTIRANQQESTELGRSVRQQRIIDAIVSSVVSKESVLHPREVPRAVVQPLLTDLNASQLVSTGFAKWWSRDDNNLRCRLGGDEAYRNGEAVLTPNEDNRAAVRMWLGKQGPVKPRNAVSAGCLRQGG